jgi:hypothetical protein
MHRHHRKRRNAAIQTRRISSTDTRRVTVPSFVSMATLEVLQMIDPLKWLAAFALSLAIGAIGGGVLLLSQPPSPGTALVCGAGLTVLMNGSPLSAGCVLNIKAGTGIVATPQADPAIGGTDLSFSINSASIPTHPQVQAGENICVSSNGTHQYACQLQPAALTAYTNGMWLSFSADVACSSGCTLNALVPAQSPGVTIYQPTGSTNASVASGWHLLVYDASIVGLRLLL